MWQSGNGDSPPRMSSQENCLAAGSGASPCPWSHQPRVLGRHRQPRDVQSKPASMFFPARFRRQQRARGLNRATTSPTRHRPAVANVIAASSRRAARSRSSSSCDRVRIRDQSVKGVAFRPCSPERRASAVIGEFPVAALRGQAQRRRVRAPAEAAPRGPRLPVAEGRSRAERFHGTAHRQTRDAPNSRHSRRCNSASESPSFSMAVEERSALAISKNRDRSV